MWNFQPVKVFIKKFCEYNWKEALKISARLLLLVAPEVVDADNDDNDTTNTAESDTDTYDSI